MRYVLHRVSYEDRDLETIDPVDPLRVSRAQLVFEQGEHSVQPGT
jgi:hypothetical protein